MTGEELIGAVARAGSQLGFEVDPEHWTAPSRTAGIYRPRIDCLWAVELEPFQYDCTPIDRLLGERLASPYGLLGFEVEPTDPTTKRQFSNLANLAIAAVPYAVLVVDVASHEDAFWRANRVIRSFNRRFGHREAIGVDATVLDRLSEINQQGGVLQIRSAAAVIPGGGRGGENLSSHALRKRLIEIGWNAGFEVISDASDPRLASSYEVIHDMAPRSLDVPRTPIATKTAAKAGDLFTDSRPDVVWAIRTGPGLGQVIDAFADSTPGARSIHQSFGRVPELLPVATFELESQMGKHASGAVMSLGSRPGIGFLVGPDRESAQAVLDAYRPIVGAGNVVALAPDDINSL